ncbi:hypothetical protein HK105_208153 [Polyrhizophydium stewartii]|uniref:Uncharacterized protein n=1 Tax=Polyrhizophydium stewartii TaxID=2732419 RepID=A0ABR4MYQ7_9FUNG
MSQRSKIALGAAAAFAAATIVGVHVLKTVEAQWRRVGIERDDQRRSAKRLENEAEMLRMQELRRALEQDQAVSRNSFLQLQQPQQPPPGQPRPA